MPGMPVAEFPVTADLVAQLIADQAPAFAQLPIAPVAEGWDNVMFRLGTGYAVRIPRRSVAAPLIEHEQRWLPHLARQLRVSIPVPLHYGRPALGYPWAWSIVPWIDGSSATTLPAAERDRLAGDLAAFIAELHTAAPAGAPVNPVRGVALSTRDRVTMERLRAHEIPRADELRALWSQLRDSPPWAGPPVWLHGDLHPGNLVHLGDRLASVVDFGDLTSGDPACDLATAWLTFDSDGRRAFFDALPERYSSDSHLRDRSRGWALSLSTAFAAHSDDNLAMAAIGKHTIDQVLDRP